MPYNTQKDPFAYTDYPSAPRKVVAVTPNNTTPIEPYLTGLRVTGAGTVVVVPTLNYMADENHAGFTFTLPANGELNLSIAIVKTTSTATGILGYQY